MDRTCKIPFTNKTITWHKDQPRQPSKGDAWYNPKTELFYLFDGINGWCALGVVDEQRKVIDRIEKTKAIISEVDEAQYNHAMKMLE